MHPCCLHSFSSERWTWTSRDTTQVNVYLSPLLSSWEFALHPERKPLASPLSVSLVSASAVEQRASYNTDKVRPASAETAQKQETPMTLHLTPQQVESGLKGRTGGRMRIMNLKDWHCQLLTSFKKANPDPKCNYHWLSASYLSFGPQFNLFSFQSRCCPLKGEARLKTFILSTRHFKLSSLLFFPEYFQKL